MNRFERTVETRQAVALIEQQAEIEAVKKIFDERRNRLDAIHHRLLIEYQEARQQAEDEAIKNVFNLCMKRFNKTRQTAAPVECQGQQPGAEDQDVKTADPEKATPIESKRTQHRAEDEDAVKIIFDERRNRLIETHHIAAPVERQEARQQAEDEAIKNVFNLCMKRFNKTRQTAAPVECQGQQPGAEDQDVKTADPEKATPIESKRTQHRAEDEDAVKIIFDERRNRLIETHHIAAPVERQEARQQAEDEAIKNVFNLCMKRFNKTRQTAAPVECQGQQPRAEDQGVKTAGPEKVTPIESKRTRHRAEDEDAVKIIFDERRNRLIETHHIAAQVERQEARQQAEDEAIKNVFNLCMKRFNKTRQTAAPVKCQGQQPRAKDDAVQTAGLVGHQGVDKNNNTQTQQMVWKHIRVIENLDNVHQMSTIGEGANGLVKLI
ncbi:uncharacterized protein LOC121879429 [Homarus americanus]|uniref:uncharacterized protein LOC121879429 n=1 Tax=Homarus americanus TaxID=6706 RepID=UPI001C490358|nr:uncharacterized protein LOC121879429 [Homarus americanus]